MVRSTNQPQTSYDAASSLSELELKRILINKMEENNSINRSNVQKNLYEALVEAYNNDKDLLSSYGKEGNSSKETSRKKSRTTSSSRETTRSQPMDLEDLTHQEFITGSDEISNLAHAAGSKSYFDEFLATSIDFSAFMMNRLKIDHLTQKMLTGPTYDLIKGSCKSKPYPHNLSKPLPLIPNARGRLVIPFDHFINNDLEYLKGGSSSRKYTTSITKTKAADYGDVKWIEDRIPRNTWSTVPMEYDRHAYWGTYHWGPKRQKFYGYATNMETSKDIYSKHRIIAITNLKIMTFYGYSHLEEIIVRRQDD
ncbi:hypothetical protein Tco_1149530 [Tanacetum coccineum]